MVTLETQGGVLMEWVPWAPGCSCPGCTLITSVWGVVGEAGAEGRVGTCLFYASVLFLGSCVQISTL